MSTANHTTVVVVLTTLPDEAAARALARRLVEERLIACANVVPAVTSIYRWEGEVRDEAEVLVVMKTTRDRMPEVESRIAELHPYDVPEVLGLPSSGGSRPYLDWVTAEVGV